MATELDSLISVTISSDATNISRTGYGTPVVMSYHTRFADNYRIYNDLPEMVDDGFETYDDAYRLARAAFLANPKPARVVVGRLPSAPAYTRTVTILSDVEGQYIRFKVLPPLSTTAVQIEYLIPAAATTTSVATAVELLVEAVTGVDSSAASAVVTVTPTVAGRNVYIYDLENVAVEDTTADAGFDDALTALEGEYDDWYWVLISSGSEANIDLVADWVETRRKLFGATVSNTSELTGTGEIGMDLKALGYDRTFLVFSKNPSQHAAARLVGEIATRPAGAYAAAYKQMTGVTADTLTTTQRTNLTTDNINRVSNVNSSASLLPGVVVSGEWIDIMHGTDALTTALQEDLLSLLISADKIPFTAAGGLMVKNTMLSTLQRFEGETALLVPGSSTVTLPDFATIPSGEKMARFLDRVKFSAQYNGAVVYLGLVGTLTV